jgi:hypothetical protein
MAVRQEIGGVLHALVLPINIVKNDLKSEIILWWIHFEKFCWDVFVVNMKLLWYDARENIFFQVKNQTGPMKLRGGLVLDFSF